MTHSILTRRELLAGALGAAAVSATAAGALPGEAPRAPLAVRPGKVTLEEHFVFPGAIDTTFHPIGIDPAVWRGIESRLLDVEQYRLAEMDAHGIDIQVVSLNANGIQAETSRAQAVRHARQANDWLAEKFLATHPTRFAGFAAVALQDPQAAADELERAVTQLHFKGALINGYTELAGAAGGEYLDVPKFHVFWERAQALDVPVYLHPRVPMPSQRLIYQGHDEMLGPMWAFAAETAAHALRLITSGLFDRFPKQQLILGHMGEGLIAMMARAQRRFEYAPCGKTLLKPLTQYVKENFHITTSGNFHTPTLNNVIAEMGIDRVLFSVDYPYERTLEGAEWFDHCPLEGPERAKVAGDNARRLLKLPAA